MEATEGGLARCGDAERKGGLQEKYNPRGGKERANHALVAITEERGVDLMLAVGRVVKGCRSVGTFASAEVPVMSRWNEQDSGEEGDGIPTPRRPENPGALSSAATEAHGGV